jgi:predicted peptidase
MRWVTLLCVLLTTTAVFAQDDIDGFKARVYRNASGDTLPYRIFIPPSYDAEKQHPLVLWLHGAGGAGTDNVRNVSEDQIPGTRLWTKPEHQAKNPAFVVVPQSPANWVDRLDGLTPEMQLVIEILNSVKAEFNIDAGRMYVAGQSDGGYGTWNLITQRPEMFAAAIPLCGGGDPKLARLIAKLPIWVFHGRRDDVIPVSESRKMVDAMRRAGGRPRFTEYPRIGHDIWDPTFAEPQLVPWLFSQRR